MCPNTVGRVTCWPYRKRELDHDESAVEVITVVPFGSILWRAASQVITRVIEVRMAAGASAVS